MFPFIIVSSEIYIPSYFLVFSITYMICLYWLYLRAPAWGLVQTRVLDFSFIVMLGGFIGARLFHVFYEYPDFYLNNPMQMFKFWQGGFVFYGGVLGASLPAYFYLKHYDQSIKEWLNFLTPIIAFGYVLGRFATLLSGSGYGKPTHLPWGIVYPHGPEAPAGIALHPTPVYSMIWNGIALAFIMVVEKCLDRNHVLRRSPILFLIFIMWHGLGRVVIEQFRNDFRGHNVLGLSVSSWISVAIILGAGGFLFAFFKPLQKHQKN